MYYQNEPGIYVYYYKTIYYETYQTRKIAYSHYSSLEEFFGVHHEYTIKEWVGYTIDDKICNGVIETSYRRGYRG